MNSQMAKKAETKVCVGVITGAQGIRGQVRVKSFTAEPTDIAAYGPLTDANGSREFRLELTGSAKGVLLARVTGISDRNAAETLRGIELYVDRDALPEPEEEEFYHADLIGLPAVLSDGSPFGTVRALYDFGAGDVIEIILDAGGVAVLPFTHAVVPDIDLAAGRITIVPPTEIEARGEEDTDE
ncbi:MAG: ribosome maturation factor RimM [Proteobacteria bacterium]|nr:ribosome maturation factor RimM [Pseudomonadota bacterium]